jgi:hypothetical protein
MVRNCFPAYLAMRSRASGAFHGEMAGIAAVSIHHPRLRADDTHLLTTSC